MQDSRIELRSFELDRESYKRALWRELPRRHRRLILIVAAVGGLFACVVAWSVYASGSLSPFWKALPTYILGGWWYWWCFRRTPSNMARNPLNRFQFDTYHIAIGGGLIHGRKSSGSSSTLPLAQIVKVSKDDYHYLLYENSSTAIFIPRSAFASPADEAEFERQLSQRTAGAAA